MLSFIWVLCGLRGKNMVFPTLKYSPRSRPRRSSSRLELAHLELAFADWAAPRKRPLVDLHEATFVRHPARVSLQQQRKLLLSSLLLLLLLLLASLTPPPPKQPPLQLVPRMPLLALLSSACRWPGGYILLACGVYSRTRREMMQPLACRPACSSSARVAVCHLKL